MATDYSTNDLKKDVNDAANDAKDTAQSMAKDAKQAASDTVDKIKHSASDIAATARERGEEFVATAFAAVGLDWRRHVVRDPKLVRPTEIEWGRADTRRATERLGWTARHALPDVVRMMVEARIAEQPATRRAA